MKSSSQSSFLQPLHTKHSLCHGWSQNIIPPEVITWQMITKKAMTVEVITIQTFCDSLLCPQVVLWATLSHCVRMSFPCDFFESMRNRRLQGLNRAGDTCPNFSPTMEQKGSRTIMNSGR